MSMKDKTLLVVDDVPEICELFVEIFEDEFKNIIVANHGNDAIKKFESESVDVIVSDIRMPGGDAVVLIDYLKEKVERKIPVLLMTGNVDFNTLTETKSYALDVIKKPIDWDVCLEILNSAV